MKKLLFLLTFLSFQTFAHFKPYKTLIFATISKGMNYQRHKEYKHQQGIGPHVRYMKSLVKEDKGYMLIHYINSYDSSIILSASSINEAEKILNKSKAIQNKVLKFKLHEINITELNIDHNKLHSNL